MSNGDKTITDMFNIRNNADEEIWAKLKEYSDSCFSSSNHRLLASRLDVPHIKYTIANPKVRLKEINNLLQIDYGSSTLQEVSELPIYDF